MIKRWTIWLAGLLAMLLIASPALADEVYAETPIVDATEEQLINIQLAIEALDGTVLNFGDAFSFNLLVGERSEERGFVPATNGRGVDVVGGGVAQTATTLYLALMQRDDIEYSSIYTYNESFSAGYVESGYDAIATDYANQVDFAFNSYYEGTLSIFMWTTEDMLCCYVVEDCEEGL